MNIEDSFQIEVGEKYKMKLELFGDLISKDDVKNFGEKIAFKILEKQLIGKIEFYKVLTKIGIFYIRREYFLDIMINNGIRDGWYNFTRIDVIQLDNAIHPELL